MLFCIYELIFSITELSKIGMFLVKCVCLKYICVCAKEYFDLNARKKPFIYNSGHRDGN